MSETPVRPVLESLGADLSTEHKGKMICPFHPDTNPSAQVSEFYFKCWSCEAHGDAIRLLVDQGGLTFAEAYSRAEELTGISSEPRGEEPASRGSVSFRERVHRRNRPFVPPRSAR